MGPTNGGRYRQVAVTSGLTVLPITLVFCYSLLKCKLESFKIPDIFDSSDFWVKGFTSFSSRPNRIEIILWKFPISFEI